MSSKYNKAPALGHKRSKPKTRKICPICSNDSGYQTWLECDTATCKQKYHPQCLDMDREEYEALKKWNCRKCTDDIADREKEAQRQAALLVQNSKTCTIRNSDISANSDTGEDDSSDDESYAQDQDGYALVKGVIDWKMDKDGQRLFRVIFKHNDKRQWVREEDCDGCIDLVNDLCRTKKIAATQVGYRIGHYNNGKQTACMNNYENLQETLKLAKIFCHKDLIQPEQFIDPIKPRDTLSFHQIKQHCFVLLYMARTKAVYIAEAHNFYVNNSHASVVYKLLLQLKRQEYCRRIYGLTVVKKTMSRHYVSSTVALAMELQLLHKKGLDLLEKPIKLDKDKIEKIQKTLNKRKEKKAAYEQKSAF